MENFSPTNLVKAQTILDARFAAPEMRMAPYPVTALMLSNGPFMIADYEELRVREDRPTEVNFMTRTKRAASNGGRTHNHTGVRGDSTNVTPTYTPYSDTFTISLKQLDNNVFGFEQALANGLLQCMQNIVEDMEVANAAWLRTYRSGYSRALKGKASFNVANKSLEIAAADGDKQRFFQYLKSAMKQNLYKQRLDVISDNILAADAEFLSQQGNSNATNYGFQFSNMNIAESNDLADANYPEGIVIAMPEQTICMMPWIPKQNRVGHGDYNTYVGGFGSMSDPWGLGLEFAVHGYATRADASAYNGDTQDVVLEFELSLDVSRNKAPLTVNADETVLFQAGLKP